VEEEWAEAEGWVAVVEWAVVAGWAAVVEWAGAAVWVAGEGWGPVVKAPGPNLSCRRALMRVMTWLP